MAEMANDLEHLDQVVLPDKYEPDEPPPAPLGDLPPWRTTIPILAIIFGLLVLAGFAAQLLHRPPTP
jgi:hypothetical protein